MVVAAAGAADFRELIDGNEYTAHIRVRNTDMGDKYYGHTLSAVVEEIEIEPSARVSDEKTSVQPVNASSSTGSSVSQPGQNVNTFSKIDVDKLGGYILSSFGGVDKGKTGEFKIPLIAHNNDITSLSDLE